jgi:hypothetical protein
MLRPPQNVLSRNRNDTTKPFACSHCDHVAQLLATHHI